ncbi:hypothetical protein F4678DRAFT_426054 [Xylaria arbuscula]|nr:hypothetical protein F4678DRAFT_426054 [Xylaria arbuscula]
MEDTHMTETPYNIISQFPFLNGYTHLIRVFKLEESGSRADTFNQVRHAFRKLHFQIPWLHHQVLTNKKSNSASEITTSAPWPRSGPANDVIRVDMDRVLPSFQALINSGCPLSSIPSQHVARCPGLPQAHGLSIAPVMGVQVTFIEGGALVTLSTHHNMIDGQGTMLLWEYLATLMSGGDIPAEEIKFANIDRSHAIPLLSAGTPQKDYSHLIRPDPWPLPPPPQTMWRVYMMKWSDLASIRSSFTQNGGNGTDKTSVDDDLSAWCWKGICAARLRTGRFQGQQTTKFGRALDARRSVGIVRGYLGHMVMHTSTRMSFDEVIGTTVSDLARRLKADRAASSTEQSVRSYATFLASVKNKSKIMYGGLHNPETDIGGSSLLHWAKRPLPDMGLLGQSHAFRRAGGPTIPSCMYFFPSDQDNFLQIVLCMTEETLSSLEADAAWNRYAKVSRGNQELKPRL